MKYTLIRTGSLLFFLILASDILAQDSLRVITIERFKWTIGVPKRFKDFTAEKQAETKQRGLNKIEETEGVEVLDQSTTMIMVQNSQLNYLDAVYQPYENTEGVDYAAYCKDVEAVIYRTFSSVLGGVKLDTTSGKVVVGGLEFHKFFLTGKLPDGKSMKLHMFSRPFGKEEFAVNILAVDEADEKALLDAWMNSRFAK